MNKISLFTEVITEFITFKRTGGYKYQVEADILMQFNTFLIEQNVREMNINQEIMDLWCRQKMWESRKTLSNRVSAIRQFAIYASNRGYPVTTPDVVKNSANRLFVPYIFNNEEIHRIFKTIDNLPGGRSNNSHIVYPVTDGL